MDVASGAGAAVAQPEIANAITRDESNHRRDFTGSASDNLAASLITLDDNRDSSEVVLAFLGAALVASDGRLWASTTPSNHPHA